MGTVVKFPLVTGVDWTAHPGVKTQAGERQELEQQREKGKR